jgi:hypothetical protein
MGAVRIVRDHLAKLYQFLDGFSRVSGAVNDSGGYFQVMGSRNFPGSAVFALRYGKICDNAHMLSRIPRETARVQP